MAKLKALPRNYGLLDDLNTRPRTTYLGYVRNSNEALRGQRGNKRILSRRYSTQTNHRSRARIRFSGRATITNRSRTVSPASFTFPGRTSPKKWLVGAFIVVLALSTC